MLCRDSGLPSTHGTLWVLQNTFSKVHLLEKDTAQFSSKIYGMTSSSFGLGHVEHWRGTAIEGKVRQYQVHDLTRTLQSELILVRMVDYLKFPISEVHLGKFLETLEFQLEFEIIVSSHHNALDRKC